MTSPPSPFSLSPSPPPPPLLPFPQENVSLRYGVVIRVSHLSVEDKQNRGQYIHVAHYDKPSLPLPLPPFLPSPPPPKRMSPYAMELSSGSLISAWRTKRIGANTYIIMTSSPSPPPPPPPKRECLLTLWSCHQGLSSQHGGQRE